jgi:FkbM family methyltransferase
MTEGPAAMRMPIDRAPYGAQAPDRLVRAVLALTRRLPANWLGFRVSTPFRRIAIDWLAEKPVDATVWGARARLYPSRNSCEKNALFTPQVFDQLERRVLAQAIRKAVKQGRTFCFIDIGANVGLYSLFVAQRGGARARILAIEAQPDIAERLRFNAGLNPGADIVIQPLAVADREGEVELMLDERDRAGSYVRKGYGRSDGSEVIKVCCRPLLALVEEAGFDHIDALKIDIEGAEDLALAPFLRDAPPELLPRLVLIEDRPDWGIDLYGLLTERGYVRQDRSRHNIILTLT